jgi:diphthamide synthase (EF-2-diphthine--ammonia ligase)
MSRLPHRLRFCRIGALSEDPEVIEELHGLQAQGVRQAVFVSSTSGGRDVRYARICRTTGLSPQWVTAQWSSQDVLDRIIAGRIEAVCVGVNTRYLPAWFCGHRFDKAFIDGLPPGVDPLGANGEFRTCVTNSLLFREPVLLTIDGRYRYHSSGEAGGDQCWTALLRRPLWTA